jgi:hypothetical protein
LRKAFRVGDLDWGQKGGDALVSGLRAVPVHAV